MLDLSKDVYVVYQLLGVYQSIVVVRVKSWVSLKKDSSGYCDLILGEKTHLVINQSIHSIVKLIRVKLI